MFLIDEDLKLIKKVFGGEYQHVGLYDKNEKNLQKAAKATIEKIVKLIPRISKSSNVLFLGTGAGSVPKYFAVEIGCKIECIHPGPKDNKLVEKAIVKLEAEKTFHVTTAQLIEIPHGIETFDLVIALDTLYAVEDKETLFRNILRVLKPEGRFIFTDYLATDKLKDSDNNKISTLVGINFLASQETYELLARKYNMYRVYLKSFADGLKKHYSLIEENFDKAKLTTKEKTSNVIQQYELLAPQIKNGAITWGLIMFQKIND